MSLKLLLGRYSHCKIEVVMIKTVKYKLEIVLKAAQRVFIPFFLLSLNDNNVRRQKDYVKGDEQCESIFLKPRFITSLLTFHNSMEDIENNIAKEEC